MDGTSTCVQRHMAHDRLSVVIPVLVVTSMLPLVRSSIEFLRQSELQMSFPGLSQASCSAELLVSQDLGRIVGNSYTIREKLEFREVSGRLQSANGVRSV